MKRCIFLSGLLLIWAAVGGCSTQIVHVPIDPYVTHDLASRPIRLVAVLPVVIPDYLVGQGGEVISVEITNQFMTELANRRLYDMTGGDQVREAMQEAYGNPRDWLYEGNVSGAIKIGRKLKVDGVIFGRVKRYIQTNLAENEVEIEFQLVEISSMETVWSVRELMIGKGGSPTLNEPVTTPTSNQLSQFAVSDAGQQLSKIYETGGPIEVSTVSSREIWGYSLLSAGAVATVTAGYYFTLSYNAYQRYQDAENSADLARFRSDVQDYDQMWMIMGGAGLALLGTGTYLLLTDPSRGYAADQPGHASRVAIIPMAAPNYYFLGCQGRF